MKRFLSVLIASLMVVSMLPVMTFATETRTVYIDPVSGLDTNNGLTEQAPVKTLTAAYAALEGAEAGKVVFLDTLSLSSLTNFPAHTIPVTLTSKTGEEGISSSKNIYFNGPTTLEKMTLTSRAADGTVLLAGGGHKFTIGENVVTEKTTSYYFSLCGGSNAGNCNGVDLTVKSGTWRNIYIGSHAARTVNGDCAVTLSGMTLTGGVLSAGYQATITGNVTVSITDSTISSIYALVNTSTGCVQGDFTVTLGQGATVTTCLLEDGSRGAVKGTTTLIVDGGQVTTIKKNSAHADSGQSIVMLKNGRVDTCKAAADSVQVDITAGKTLTIGGQVEATSLQSAGTLCFTGNSSLTAESVTGTVNCNVVGEVLENHLYVDVPTGSDVQFDPATGIVENNGQWTVGGAPADEDFAGLVLTAKPEITVTLYSGVKEEDRVAVTPTRTVTGEINYYYYEISSGYYHYIAKGSSAYYKIQKNIYLSSAEAAVKTVLDVTPPLRSGEGWEQKTNVKLYTDEVLENIRKDDPAQWPDYADIFTTPYFTENRTTYQMTTQDQMEAFIDQLDGDNDNLYVYNAGQSSTYGYDIDAIVVTKTDLSGTTTLEQAAALVGQDKPTILYRAHMHGSEPASGEAALAILQRLDGELGAQILDKINIVIIPRNSPDAAYNYERYIPDGTELNRDNMLMGYSETDAYHRVHNLFQPELVLDGHEFLAPTMGSYIEYDDAQIGIGFCAENSKEFEDAYRPMIAQVQQNLTDNGLYYRYYTNLADTDGSASGSRSYSCLQGTMFVLIESHGIGNGTEGYHRRVVSHVVSMQTMIEYAAENADTIQAVVNAERQRIIAEGATYEESDQIVLQLDKAADESYTHPAIHIYQSGKIVNETIIPQVRNVILRSRTAPTAYVIPAGNDYIDEILALMDKQQIAYEFIPAGSVVQLQQYSGVLGSSSVTDVTLSDEMLVNFEKGAYVFCKNQVKGKILSAFMEPDIKSTAKHNLVYWGMVPSSDGSFPIYRYIHDLNEAGFIDYSSPENPQILTEDLTDLVLTSDLYLDLNGHSITGVVTGEYKLQLKDSSTDDFEGVYGKITGVDNAANVQALAGYLMVSENGEISFHKYEMELEYVNISPSRKGISYTTTFHGDEAVKAQVKEFGIAMRLYAAPNATTVWADPDGITHVALAQSEWQTGNHDEAVKSVYIKNILDWNATDAENLQRAAIPIYGRSYIQLQSGEMIFSEAVGFSMQSTMEEADRLWNELGTDNQTALVNMYLNPENHSFMQTWNLPNIKTAAGENTGVDIPA